MKQVIPSNSPGSSHSELTLEILHQQSKNWLSEIAFWRDEIAFFYSLVAGKTKQKLLLYSKKNIQRIEKELIIMTAEEISKLEREVEEHEKNLGHLMESEHNKDEEGYRKKHYQLTLLFNSFENKIKSLRKEVFKNVKPMAKKQA